MTQFLENKIVNEYRGGKIRNWLLNGTRKIDDIFGPYLPTENDILEKQDDYLIKLKVPFITTENMNLRCIWKEQKVAHVKD